MAEKDEIIERQVQAQKVFSMWFREFEADIHDETKRVYGRFVLDLQVLKAKMTRHIERMQRQMDELITEIDKEIEKCDPPVEVEDSDDE